jgi:hypothetical protein
LFTRYREYVWFPQRLEAINYHRAVLICIDMAFRTGYPEAVRMHDFPLKKVLQVFGLLAAVTLLSVPARATMLFDASLTGAQEVPPTASQGTGFGTVLLNNALTQITVDLSWSGLTAAATAATIHGPAAPGMNAPVIFSLFSVPAATSGATPEETFAITPAQVADLEAGLFYFNIHTSNFPGGEIRGQILAAVPEQGGTCVLLGVSIASLVAFAHWTRSPKTAG